MFQYFNVYVLFFFIKGSIRVHYNIHSECLLIAPTISDAINNLNNIYS